MVFYVYILLCENNSFYTGYTKDVENRVKLHQNGKGARYTRIHKPKKIVYLEKFEIRAKAMRREKEIKLFTHKQKLDLVEFQNKHESDKTIFNYKKSIIQSSCMTKKLSWTEKLHDNKNLPKVEVINEKNIKRWGPGTIVIPAPIEVDEFMRKVPKGKLTTITEIRKALAEKHNATFGCPLTTGIFTNIAAKAAVEQQQKGEKNVTPYWRTLKADGMLNEKFPGGVDIQKELLESEGHKISSKGKKFYVTNYLDALIEL